MKLPERIFIDEAYNQYTENLNYSNRVEYVRYDVVDVLMKNAITFTLRHIENSLCDQQSNGIFNDFKNTVK